MDNDKIVAQAESKPKISGGAVVLWILAALFLLPGTWGAIETEEMGMFITFVIIAAIPALIGLAIHFSMLKNAKKTVLIAADKCIYCKSESTKRYSYGDGLMELPYESIVNIRVSPEGISKLNGDMVVLYMPGSMVSFRNITNAPEIVMAIKSKVEEIKGPMPPYGYPVMMPPAYGAPMGYAQPQYGQPMYGAQPQYGQPMYGAQPQYGQPMYGVQPQYSQPMYGAQPQHGQPNNAAPQQPIYQPVRPEYDQPQQPVYPDAAKPDDDRPLFDSETGERIIYSDMEDGNG